MLVVAVLPAGENVYAPEDPPRQTIAQPTFQGQSPTPPEGQSPTPPEGQNPPEGRDTPGCQHHGEQDTTRGHRHNETTQECGEPVGQAYQEASQTSLAGLEECKARLNHEKGKLDKIPSKSFGEGRRHADIGFQIKQYVAERVRNFWSEKWPKFAKQASRNVTNAWLKGWEVFHIMINSGSLRLDADCKLFANAEFPGAFLCAFEHLLEARYPEAKASTRWVASSLYPQRGNGALKDTMGMFRTRRRQWLMDGPGDRAPCASSSDPEAFGDLTVLADVVEIARRARRDGEVDVYISDGGLGVQDFNRQESENAKLHFGQALCGLLALRKGGTMVLKMYTFFEPGTRSLIAYLASAFESARIIKPLTSRAANSEIYLHLAGFAGVSEEDFQHLFQEFSRFVAEPDPARAPWSWPGRQASDRFAAALLYAAELIHGHEQVAALNEIVTHCENLRRLRGCAKAKAKYTEQVRARQAPEIEAWHQCYPV